MTGQPDESLREEPAWVKCSTGLKQELATLDGYSLKVFLYIGLSVNFANGTAYPSIRKIAKDIGMSKNTVSKAVETLEQRGFLTIVRREGARNSYKPTRYISIGTVPPQGTPKKTTVPRKPKTVPRKRGTVPRSRRDFV